MEETFKCGVTFEFKKVEFIPKNSDDGRCLECDARDYCGGKFRCPCNMDEQLMLISTNGIDKDVMDWLKSK